MDKKFLVIELDEVSSVPKIYYQGEEITRKVKINFEWETKNDEPCSGGMELNIDHYVKEEKALHLKSISHKVTKF